MMAVLFAHSAVPHGLPGPAFARIGELRHSPAMTNESLTQATPTHSASWPDLLGAPKRIARRRDPAIPIPTARHCTPKRDHRDKPGDDDQVIVFFQPRHFSGS